MDENTQATTPDETTMTGGLPDMTVEAPQTTTEDVGVTTEQLQPASNKKSHVVGDKVFETPEEALAYANGLVSAQSAFVNSVTKPTQTTDQPVKPKLGSLLFEDPDAALEQLEQRALDRFKAEQTQIEQGKKIWEDFYSKHSDLKGAELLVDALFTKGQSSGRWNNVTLEQGTEILAREAREQVLKIKGASSGGQALPSKPAMVAGSSGASAPKVPAPKPVVTDFVTELRMQRQKG